VRQYPSFARAYYIIPRLTQDWSWRLYCPLVCSLWLLCIGRSSRTRRSYLLFPARVAVTHGGCELPDSSGLKHPRRLTSRASRMGERSPPSLLFIMRFTFRTISPRKGLSASCRSSFSCSGGLGCSWTAEFRYECLLEPSDECYEFSPREGTGFFSQVNHLGSVYPLSG